MDDGIRAERPTRHMEALACDELEGRAPGTRGAPGVALAAALDSVVVSTSFPRERR